MAAALIGPPDALAPLPGADRDDGPLGQAMVSALWSVLWHHAMVDLGGVDAEAARQTGLWAGRFLAPEGPLPAIRVGTQPYGLLPTTSLRRWSRASGDPDIEMAMVEPLVGLGGVAATAARTRGTVVGADTERLVSILAQPPCSPGYASRWFISLDLWIALLAAFGEAPPVSEPQMWWDEVHQAALGLGLQPTRRHVALGSAQDLELPLVEPIEPPDGFDLKALLRFLADLPPSTLIHGDGLDEILVEGQLPASLLVRLVARAMVLTAAEVERVRLKDPEPLIEPITTPVSDPGRIGGLAMLFNDSHLIGDPASLLYESARNAVQELANAAKETEVLERILRATLDTAMYRVDPWITGLATRRLAELADQQPDRRLGVYGWVDRPTPGTPGAIPGTLLMAPDATQAHTAAVLRDRSLFDDQPARWYMDIDSAVVQEAARIAAEVRVGSHLSEALGRRVERLVGDPVAVDALRAGFPVRTEHDGRRTCDGQAVLQALATNPSAIPSSVGTPARAAMAELGAVVDAYADLLVADAVHDVVSGRGDVAGASMEAAAGFGPPPALDVIQTPRTGRAVNSNLLIAIPRRPTDRPGRPRLRHQSPPAGRPVGGGLVGGRAGRRNPTSVALAGHRQHRPGGPGHRHGAAGRPRPGPGRCPGPGPGADRGPGRNPPRHVVPGRPVGVGAWRGHTADGQPPAGGAGPPTCDAGRPGRRGRGAVGRAGVRRAHRAVGQPTAGGQPAQRGPGRSGGVARSGGQGGGAAGRLALGHHPPSRGRRRRRSAHGPWPPPSNRGWPQPHRSATRRPTGRPRTSGWPT